MEGCEVMGLIMEKVELSSAPDGNERRRGGISVSNSTASLTALSEKKTENRHPLSLSAKGLVWVARN